MWLMLSNSLILLFAIALPIGSLFWKHFAKRPGESIKAIITTVSGMFGMALFFIQVAIMTATNQNVLTIILEWFNTRF